MAYIYVLVNRVESSFCTSCTCLVFQQRCIQNPFNHLRWSIFAFPINKFNLLTVYAKTHSLRCLKGFRISDQIAPGNVLCHHSKHLMGYFKFQHDSNIICIPLNSSEKLATISFEKLEEAETHYLYLYL